MNALPALLASVLSVPGLVVPVTPADGDARDHDVDVAWDADTRRFCNVWERYLSDGTAECWAQVFEESGARASDPILIGKSAVQGRAPAVCNVNDGDLFVVAYAPKDDVYGDHVTLVALEADSLASWPALLFHAPDIESLDIGGDPLKDSREVCVVWSDEFGIRGRRAQILGPHEFGDSEAFTFEDGESLHNRFPRISQSSGSIGNWLVVWLSTATGFAEVHAAAVAVSGGVGPVHAWSTGAFFPSCDGNGKRFVVAYEAAFGHEIHGMHVEVAPGGTLSLLAIDVLHKDVSYSVHHPQVAITSNGFDNAWTVAWRKADTIEPHRVQVRSFDDALQPISALNDVASRVRDLRIASLRAANFHELFVERFAFGMGRWFGPFYAVGTP